jgi:hypothetical protein
LGCQLKPRYNGNDRFTNWTKRAMPLGFVAKRTQAPADLMALTRNGALESEQTVKEPHAGLFDVANSARISKATQGGP